MIYFKIVITVVFSSVAIKASSKDDALNRVGLCSEPSALTVESETANARMDANAFSSRLLYVILFINFLLDLFVMTVRSAMRRELARSQTRGA